MSDKEKKPAEAPADTTSTNDSDDIFSVDWEGSDESPEISDDADIAAAAAVEGGSEKSTDQKEDSKTEATPVENADTAKPAESAPKDEPVKGAPAEPTGKADPDPDFDDEDAKKAEPTKAELTEAEQLLQKLGLAPQAETDKKVDPAATPAPAAPAPAAPQAQPQQQAPAQPAPQVQPQQPAPQQPPQVDPAAVMDDLAKNHYALDADTAQALRDEGNDKLVEMVPQIAARVFVDAVTTIRDQVMQTMPQILAQHEQTRSKEQLYEDAFHTYWKDKGYDLRPYNDDLTAVGAAYRQANPQASEADFFNHVGASVIMSRQIQQHSGAAGIPATPADPQAPAQTPFQSAGNAPGATAPKPELEGYAAIDMELFGEDEF